MPHGEPREPIVRFTVAVPQSLYLDLAELTEERGDIKRAAVTRECLRLGAGVFRQQTAALRRIDAKRGIA